MNSRGRWFGKWGLACRSSSRRRSHAIWCGELTRFRRRILIRISRRNALDSHAPTSSVRWSCLRVRSSHLFRSVFGLNLVSLPENPLDSPRKINAPMIQMYCSDCLSIPRLIRMGALSLPALFPMISFPTVGSDKKTFDGSSLATPEKLQACARIQSVTRSNAMASCRTINRVTEISSPLSV